MNDKITYCQLLPWFTISDLIIVVTTNAKFIIGFMIIGCNKSSI